MVRKDSILKRTGPAQGRPSTLTPLDVTVSHGDERTGDTIRPYGFVYFIEEHTNYDGQDVRVGFIGGRYDPEKEASFGLHETQRYAPYVWNANWGLPTFAQLVAAWDWLVENRVPGFAEYAADYPDVVRWMNGDDFISADRFTLELAAVKERQSALIRTRAHRRSSAASKA